MVNFLTNLFNPVAMNPYLDDPQVHLATMSTPSLWSGDILLMKNSGRPGMLFHLNLSEEIEFQFMPDLSVVPRQIPYDPSKFPRGNIDLLQQLIDQGWRIDYVSEKPLSIKDGNWRTKN